MAIARAVAQLPVAQLPVAQLPVVQVGRRGSVRTVIVRVLQVVGAMIGARAVTTVAVRRARANVPVATRALRRAGLRSR